MTPKTIVYGTAAILVLYFVAKQQASAAVDAVVTTVDKPFKATGDAIGSTLFNILHPFAPGSYFYTPPSNDGATVNTTTGAGGSSGYTR